MRATIQSIHFDADQSLLDFVQKKVNKLEKFYDNVVDAQVQLRLDKNKEQGNKVVEIKLQVPKDTLVGKNQSSTFEAATDETVEDLRRQLLKYKGKMNKA